MKSKKLIIFLSILLIIGILPVNAENVKKIEYTKDENVYITLPDGWYIDGASIKNTGDVVVGNVNKKTYEETFEDVQGNSLSTIKSLQYNNIMLLEKLSSRLYLYTADNKGNGMYCIVAANSDQNFIFYACIYSNRIEYKDVVQVAYSIYISFSTEKRNAEYYGVIEEYIKENNYTVTDEYATEFYTVLFLDSKKIVVITPDGTVRDLVAYSFEGEDKYSEYKITSFDEMSDILKFTRKRTDFDMLETFEVTLPNGEIKFSGTDRLASIPKPGTPIGYIYNTDILAYVDNMAIESYNVKGRTVIVVEDLEKYGFKVVWDGDTRTLVANTVAKPEIATDFTKPELTEAIGTVSGVIYATDIITEINGTVYDTYNLNGKTVVVLEEMADKNTEDNILFEAGFSSGGFKATWDNDTRTIKLFCLRPDDFLYTKLGEVAVNYQKYAKTPYLLSYVDDTMFIELSNGDVFADINELDVKYNFNVNGTLTFDTANKFKSTFVKKDQIERSDLLLSLKLNLTNGKTAVKFSDAVTAYYYGGKVLVNVNVLTELFK